MLVWLESQTFLRVLERADARALFALTAQNRHHLRKWLPWVDEIRQVEDTLRFIDATIAQRRAGQGYQMGIWHQGELAGVVGAHRIDWRNRSTEIGYWLAERFQGMGLMTRAVTAYLDRFVFGEWNLNRVEIAAATENRRSRAIPERLGFVLEGVLRQRENLYGHYVDHALYAMLAADWQKRKGELY